MFAFLYVKANSKEVFEEISFPSFFIKMLMSAFLLRFKANYKQLLDEVFVISGIIKVEVSVISRSRRLRLITLTEILIIPDITKTESNNCFIIHCFEENNDKRIIAAITVYFQTLKNVQLSDKQIFTVFIKQSSAEKLNAFLKKVSLNLYLQVISQFFAGSMTILKSWPNGVASSRRLRTCLHLRLRLAKTCEHLR